MKQCLIIAILVASMIPEWASGQDKTVDANDTKAKQKVEKAEQKKDECEKIRKSFKSIAKQVKSGDYAAAARSMTDSGRDALMIDPILTAIMMSNMPGDFQFEGGPGSDEHFDDFQAELESDIKKQKKLLAKYKFDELEIDVDPMSGPSDEVKEKIKVLLKKTGNPYEVVKKFRNASSVMMPDLFASSVESIDIATKDNRAYVELEIKPEMPGGETGVVVEVISPPVIVQFKKENQRWLFNGIDEKKTRRNDGRVHGRNEWPIW